LEEKKKEQEDKKAAELQAKLDVETKLKEERR